ncbi:hypothetical protein IAQ61_009895 [Plenodomus lingam]|uniref:uncharacterized protein n=1 Tax=Leptosphaeria maculans TaxID=5022 RepID=UPI00332C05AA|nr:hypothetical protein IAQ61_009895 [Plenodomus lingam]
MCQDTLIRGATGLQSRFLVAVAEVEVACSDDGELFWPPWACSYPNARVVGKGRAKRHME